MDEEKKERNYKIFLEKLSNVGVDTEKLDKVYGEHLKNATFTNSAEFGNAYDGSLIETVLKVLTPYAVKINELLPIEQQVDKSTLVKICLLHHISKSIRLVPNDNSWEIKTRKLYYKYDTDQPSIRTGLHSLVMAQSCGILFTAEEAEAMTVNDRDLTDDQARWYSSVMSTVIRQANELTYVQINGKR